MGVCMSINVANSQVAPEEENGFDFLKDKMTEQTQACNCTSCMKKIFCFLCL